MADFQTTVLKKLDSLEKGQERILKGQGELKEEIKLNRDYINQAFQRITDFYTLKDMVDRHEEILKKFPVKG